MQHRPASVAREDYLQTILQLAEEDIHVIRARLAERLHVSAASVSEAIRSLEDDGLVEIMDNRTINLTAHGLTQAENIVRRHRVAERILTDLLHLPWSQAHEEAHKLEHGLSDRVVDAALIVLGNPTTCPHGSPIPGTEYKDPHSHPLAEVAAPGATVTLERVGESIEARADVMKYLEDNNFMVGASGQVSTVSPDDTVTIVTRTATIALGPPITSHVFVTV